MLCGFGLPMERKQKEDREKKRGPQEGTAVSRGVKTETVAILVGAAFVLGLIVGAVAALLKTPSPTQPRQSGTPGQGEIFPVGMVDRSKEIRTLEELVQEDPENPDSWVHLGDLFYRGKQHNKAIEAYTKALSLRPRRIDVMVKLGNAYFDSNDYEKAIGAYSKALAIDPRNADTLTDLGVAYRRIRNAEKAIDAFRRAAQTDPSHSTSRYNLGVVLFHDLNDREGAIKAWEEFLQIEPSGEKAEQVKRMVETLKHMPPSR